MNNDFNFNDICEECELPVDICTLCVEAAQIAYSDMNSPEKNRIDVRKEMKSNREMIKQYVLTKVEEAYKAGKEDHYKLSIPNANNE